MESISLRLDQFNTPSPEVSAPRFPTVWLNELRDVDLPEEGVISFRYSRVRKTETETKDDETCSYELTLKAITDVCACEEDCCEEKSEDGRENMDKLMEDLKEEDMADESEDDNPSKY